MSKKDIKEAGKHRATIKDVALTAGVGLQTVSRVLNGGHYVKASTAARIQRAIKKHAYQPNEAARMLKGQRARTIGLILPDLGDPFFSACAHAIQEVATAERYMTFVLTAERKPGLEAREIAMMVGRNISGLLIIPSETHSMSVLAELLDAGIPVVTLDRRISSHSSGEVVVDNEEGTRIAIEHMIQHGHKRILALGYDAKSSTIEDRIKSYRTTMTASGLKPEVLLSDSRATVPAQLAKRLDIKPMPTAIFCLNNVVALMTLAVLDARGIEIPQKMAVIGFDDCDFASLLKVPLTAVRQPAGELGRQAARLLFQQIHDGNASSSRTRTRIVLPTELIIRESCGCPAS